MFKRSLSVPVGCLLALALAPAAHADIVFEDVTADVGVDFVRARSDDFAVIEAIREASLIEPFEFENVPFVPSAARGIPGLALFDVEMDGDLDFLVTNGPGAPNSLFINQLEETGELFFLDEAEAAGVRTEDLDANGACHGDIDNDGDDDLLILGRAAGNRLFENNGDGTFTEREASGLGDDDRIHISCSMGDIDNDGLLDIVISNSFDLSISAALFAVPFDLNQHNQLYHNDGDFTFEDVSASSGIEQPDDVPEGAATISWSVSMADVDLDGDVDIVFTDDQGNIPQLKYDPENGVDRGFLQVFKNDGDGVFTAEAQHQSEISTGGWMGISFGDLNCDGAMDMFGSNFGDYGFHALGVPYELGDQGSRWFLGDGAGGFTDPAAGTGPYPFGWGNAMFDYDNDGDSDVAFYGGLDLLLLAVLDNPGTILKNEGCSADFEPDLGAHQQHHTRRAVRGAAVGDLDRDGFVDVITSANWTADEPTPLAPMPVLYGSEFDDTANLVPIFAPVGPGQFVWTGIDLGLGNVMVERNSADNGHRGVMIEPVGGVDLVTGGEVNRGGVGAVVTFQPWGLGASMQPVTAGDSHASSGSEINFGYGGAWGATAEVLWPGGVRNRLYLGRPLLGHTIPEIPCSFDGEYAHPGQYYGCVAISLTQYLAAGVISRREFFRLFISAIVAFDQEQ